MKVIVDYRERNRELIEVLRSFDELELVYRCLPVGDYLWPNRLIFERKTLTDLMKCLQNGRIFRQAYRLHLQAMRAVLILEGTLQDLLSRHHPRLPVNQPGSSESRPSCRLSKDPIGFRRSAVQGVLIHLSVYMGIPILRSTGPAETAWLMLATARQLSVTRLPQVRAPIWPRASSLRRQRLRLLQQLPGVGPDRASSLLAHFGTPAAVLSADLRRLREVRGVGKSIAQKIREIAGDPNRSEREATLK